MIDTEKKYMLFLKEQHIEFLKGALESALEYAIRTGNKELMMTVTDILVQVKSPREVKPKRKGWGGALRDQLLG